MNKTILIVDDDDAIRKVLARFLRSHAFVVEEAATTEEAVQVFERIRPDVAVLDFRLPDGTALDILPKLRTIEPTTPILVMTGFGSMELGVALVKNGAEQCLAKPIEPPALLLVINRVLENTRNQQKQIISKKKQERSAPNPFVGISEAIQRLAEVAHKIADSNSPVLIQGETGTGKGVFANWLHGHSSRSEEPFVDLNCAGLSREFLETELFGYEKGAYTGAVTAKPGLLEIGHHGTVFLDEIGDVDTTVQPKLLKVIEEKKFRRLGDVRDRLVDIGLVAATHRDLKAGIETGAFRSDLYFRISTVPVKLPSLRERKEDIPSLATELLTKLAHDVGGGDVHLASDSIEKLQQYSWPGNIRELRNVLERALLMSGGNQLLGAEHLYFENPQSTRARVEYQSNLTLAEVERQHVMRVLEEEHGNVDQAATRLEIPRSSLYQKLRAYGVINPRRSRSTSA